MFFLASVWLFRTLVYLPQTIPKWPQFFWDDPNFLGRSQENPKPSQKIPKLLKNLVPAHFAPNFWDHPKKLGIFWDFLGLVWGHPNPIPKNPKKSQEFLDEIFHRKKFWDFLGWIFGRRMWPWYYLKCSPCAPKQSEPMSYFLVRFLEIMQKSDDCMKNGKRKSYLIIPNSNELLCSRNLFST